MPSYSYSLIRYVLAFAQSCCVLLKQCFCATILVHVHTGFRKVSFCNHRYLGPLKMNCIPFPIAVLSLSAANLKNCFPVCINYIELSKRDCHGGSGETFPFYSALTTSLSISVPYILQHSVLCACYKKEPKENCIRHM